MTSVCGPMKLCLDAPPSPGALSNCLVYSYCIDIWTPATRGWCFSTVGQCWDLSNWLSFHPQAHIFLITQTLFFGKIPLGFVFFFFMVTLLGRKQFLFHVLAWLPWHLQSSVTSGRTFNMWQDICRPSIPEHSRIQTVLCIITFIFAVQYYIPK